MPRLAAKCFGPLLLPTKSADDANSGGRSRRLIFPTSGTARLLGKPTSDIEMHRDIGYLPEQPYFYDYLTAAEVLDYFAKFYDLSAVDRKDRVQRMLKKVGLETAGNIQLRKYSKGMLQRVGLAQAILHDPQLVILDEPMSGLDPVGRREVRDIILELKKQGKTVLFSTHILSEVEQSCSKVIIINNGMIVASDTVANLHTRGRASEAIRIEVAGAAPNQVKQALEKVAGVASVESRESRDGPAVSPTR